MSWEAVKLAGAVLWLLTIGSCLVGGAGGTPFWFFFIGAVVATIASIRIRTLNRETVLEAARQTAAQQQRDQTQPPTPNLSIAERLADLESLKGSGAITEEEYAAKRQAILDDL